MIDSQIDNSLRFRHISLTAIAICLFVSSPADTRQRRGRVQSASPQGRIGDPIAIWMDVNKLDGLNAEQVAISVKPTFDDHHQTSARGEIGLTG